MGAYASWVSAQSSSRPHRLSPLLIKQAASKLARHVPRLHQRIRLWRQGSIDSSIPPALAKFVEKPLSLSRASLHDGKALRVLHCIGSLIPGGAERQLCNFVVHAKRQGVNIDVLTLRQPIGDDAHYLDLLHQVGVHPIVAGAELNSDFCKRMLASQEPLNFLQELPIFFQPYTIDILGEMVANPPDIVHAWLDHNNMWAGLAAILAGVPIVILSTRNVNPTHFPYLSHPLFKPWYQLFATCPRVHFVNNSSPGALDYAEWLGLPLKRFHVIRNGLDFASIKQPDAAAVASFRRELGLSTDATVVAGVFRLSDEKAPLLFAEVMRRAMKKHRHLHAVIAGVGPREPELRKTIEESGFSHRFHLLGRRKDVPVIMSTAEVVMLTSLKEGIPNVLLEAQWLGRPVISTKAGGAVEAMRHESTGILVDVGDAENLTRELLQLLENPCQRKRLGEAGPGFIKTHFGVDRMVAETMELYRHALG
jgi:glycosyltransferase involved in cell wall biosynthesis